MNHAFSINGYSQIGKLNMLFATFVLGFYQSSESMYVKQVLDWRQRIRRRQIQS